MTKGKENFADHYFHVWVSLGVKLLKRLTKCQLVFLHFTFEF